MAPLSLRSLDGRLTALRADHCPPIGGHFGACASMQIFIVWRPNQDSNSSPESRHDEVRAECVSRCWREARRSGLPSITSKSMRGRRRPPRS